MSFAPLGSADGSSSSGDAPPDKSHGLTWEEVCADQSLQNLPYRIELNEWGKIEASPVGPRRREYQQKIALLLRELSPDGRTMVEPAIRTAESIKVPDVAWVSSAREENGTSPRVPMSAAPDICVELIAPGNTAEEKRHKGQLYLQVGAKEFWLCNELGDMSFFDATGRLERSALLPALSGEDRISPLTGSPPLFLE